MSNDLISRKSVLDYIEKEISTAKCTETISYLRALSVHINEYEPTAFDVDKVVEQLIDNSRLMTDSPEAFTESVRCDENPKAEYVHNVVNLYDAIDIVKAGGLDDSGSINRNTGNCIISSFD